MRIQLLLTSLVLLTSAPALAQDSDGDGAIDSADAFPCDARSTAAAFYPAETAQGMMLFEDRWPAQGDLDFNDVVFSQQMIFRLNAAGQMTSMHARIVPLAIGGTIHNGLALRLPVARNAASSIARTIGTVTTQVVPAANDTQLTIVLSDDLRRQFVEQVEPINSRDDRARQNTTAYDLEITFQPAVAIDLSAAPFDLFIFRSDEPAHEIHRPQYAGTAAMAQALFGTLDDGSQTGRWFVDGDGLPFALSIPELAPYPAEGSPIWSLFPGILSFASSAGVSSRDFYRSGVVNTFAYRDVAGLGALSPAIVQPVIDRSCISVNSGPFVRIDVQFQQTIETPWVTMWEVGLMNGSTRLTSGFNVESSVANAANCNDQNTGSWCLNTSPPSSYSFVATNGVLPANTGLLLHPWYTRYPSRFTITGRRADGTSVTMSSYTEDGGWTSNAPRIFTYMNTPPPAPTGGSGGVFTYTGSSQNFVVPAGVTSIDVSMWGAGGGGGSYSRMQLSNGGGGGYTSATVAVTPGETLTVIVGGGGEGYRGSVAAGGFGGGGNAASMINAGGAGGGRSAIRRGNVELVTAGGGGGGGYDYAGAAGGGAVGQRNVGDGGGGYGGTASSGGQGGGASYVGDSGVQFRGGNATYAGGGGGGGYHGGGGAGTVNGYGNGGGGGSGWAGGAGVSAATLTAGSGITPGNASSSDRNGAGQGGAGVVSGNGNSGAHGRVIIRY